MSKKVHIEPDGIWRPPSHNNKFLGGSTYARNGVQSLPDAETLEEAKRYVERANTGEFWCCKCHGWFSDDELAGKHFAGYYCGSCWEFYKKTHSGTCIRCGNPRYECHC